MVKSRSLKFKVYTSLRNDIITGKISGGTRITENEVAASLDVSRTPVREALQKLAQERFLVAIPKAGYMVEDLSDDAIQDLFTTRQEIDQIAVKKAIDFITVEELKQLDDNLEKTSALIKSGKGQDITDLDSEFHNIIYAATRSKSLYRICKNLNDITAKYRHGLNLSSTLWNEMLSLHINIYQALISKDKNTAEKAVLAHGEKTKKHLLNVMKKIRSDSFDEDIF